jgi:hypothetical protein
MLSILINATIGFIAAGTLASLVASARAIMPAWQKLSAQMEACRVETGVRVSVREMESPLPAPAHSELPISPLRAAA